MIDEMSVFPSQACLTNLFKRVSLVGSVERPLRTVGVCCLCLGKGIKGLSYGMFIGIPPFLYGERNKGFSCGRGLLRPTLLSFPAPSLQNKHNAHNISLKGIF